MLYLFLSKLIKQKGISLSEWLLSVYLFEMARSEIPGLGKPPTPNTRSAGAGPGPDQPDPTRALRGLPSKKRRVHINYSHVCLLTSKKGAVIIKK